VPNVNVFTVAGGTAAEVDITTDDLTDGVLDDDEAIVSIGSGQQADLSLTKEISTDGGQSYSTSAELTDGQLVTFRLQVTNDAGSANNATTVTVTDLLPTGLALVNPSYYYGDGSYVSGTGVWTVGDLAKGEIKTLFLVAQVDWTATGASTITNYTQITGADQTDVDSTVNDASSGDDDDASLTVSEKTVEADLSLIKTVDNSTPAVNGTIAFTLTVINSGPDATTGVTVTDTLPANFSVTGSSFGGSATGDTFDSGTGLWTLGNIGVGEVHSLTITGTVDSASSMINFAEVSTSSINDPDSTPGNDSGQTNDEDDESSTVVTPVAADLSLTKSVSDSTPNVGDSISFTLTVINSGPSDAASVVVADALPSGFTWNNTPVFNTAATGDTFSAGVWTLGNIAVGEVHTLILTGVVNSATPFTNEAEITASSQQDPDSDPSSGTAVDDGTDGVIDDDEASVKVTPNAADLSLGKVVSNVSPQLGDNVTFTLTIVNSGPIDANNVVVKDYLPAGMTWSSGGAHSGGTVTWNVGTLAVGEVKTLDIVASVDQLTAQTNFAEVTAVDEADPDSTKNNDSGNKTVDEDDEAAVTLNPQSIDLSLSKAVSNASPNFGENVTFTLTLQNSGPSDATGVSLEDSLPDGFTYVSSSDSGVHTDNGASPDTIVWSGITIGTGASREFSIVATVSSATALTNLAEVIAADQADVDSTPNDAVGDDSASVSVDGQQTDLALTKTTSAGPTWDAAKGYYTASFTLTATNTGTDSATNVVVSDQLPGSFVYLSDNGGGAYDPNTGRWVIGTLASGGGSDSLTISVRVNSPAANTNYAQIIEVDQPDLDSTPGNDSTTEDDDASVTVDVDLIDLSLEKTVDNNFPVISDVLTYTVTLTNASGFDTANNIQVTESIPAGLTGVTVTPGSGTYSAGVWSLTSLAAGATATLTVAGIVNDLSQLNNVAEVTAADENDLDSTPNNRSSEPGEDDTAEVRPSGLAYITGKVLDDAGGYSASTFDAGDSAISGVTITLREAGLDSTFDTADDVLVTTTTNTDGVYEFYAPADTYRIDETDASGYISIASLTSIDPATGAVTLNTSTPNQKALTITAGNEYYENNFLDLTPWSITGSVFNDANTDNDFGGDTSLASVTLTLLQDSENNGSFETTLGTTLTAIDGSYSFTGLNAGVYQVAETDKSGTTSVKDTDDATGNTDSNLIDITLVRGVGDSTANNFLDVGTEADLSISKSPSNATPAVGDTITWTITVTNASTNNATGVSVQDVVPNGFNNIATISDSGTNSAGTITWSGLTVPASSSITLTFQADVLASGSYINTTQVTASDQVDPDSEPNNDSGDQSEDDEANSTVTPSGVADQLPVAKADTNTATEGGSAATGNVRDAGTAGHVADTLGDPATTVTAADQGGSALTIGNAFATAGGGSLTLNADGSYSYTPPSINNVPPGGLIETFNYTITDVDGDTSSTTLTIAVSNSALTDLSLIKTVNNASPNVGDNVTFTLTVENAGPDDATGVAVTDQLPAGFTYVSDNSSGAYNTGTGVWTVGTVSNGSNASLTITATATSASAVINSAEITSTDQPDVDSTPGNNSTTEDDDASVSVDAQQVDLSLAKSVDDAAPNIGDNVTFTLTISNTGADTATGVQVKDKLPLEFTYVSDNGAGSYDAATGIWSVGTIASGGNDVLTITAKTNVGFAVSNIAEISTADQPDIDSTPGNNSTTEDDDDSVSVDPLQADLSLSKNVDNASPNVGDNVTYTLTLVNSGPDSATGVTVTDQLPAGLTYVSDDGAGAYNSGTGVWTVGNIANGGTITLSITAQLNTASVIKNFAEITTANEPDFDSTPGDNSTTDDDDAAVEIRGLQSDLELSKSVDNAAPKLGDNVTFTLTINNAGPDAATSVQVTDKLPLGFSFVSATPSTGSYDAVTGIWSIGGLANGGSETLAITATALSPSAVTNTAEVSNADQYDPDSTVGNDSTTEDDDASVSVDAQLVDLSLAKIVDNAAPNVGDNVTFTLTVSNAGPDDATSVVVTDQLPVGFTFVSDNGATAGTYDDTTGVWTVGNVANGGSASLTITATATSASAVTNSAEITSADQPDDDSTPGNNSTTEDDDASVSVDAQQADLSLAKTVNNAAPNVGDNVTFTLTVNNAGSDDATNVVVTDQLPAGLTYVSDNSSGTYNAGTGVWTIGTISNGSNASLTITATVTSASGIINSAEVTSADQPDGDSTPGNNSGTEDDEDSVSVGAQQIDLSLAKTVDNAAPNLNDNVTFTLTVNNAGPDDATGVVVTDQLPAGFTFVSDNGATAGTYDDTTGVWTVGNVANGGSASLTITATATSASAVINSAEITSADQTDIDSTPGNNSGTEDDEDSIGVDAQQVDLSLAKTVDNAAPNIGENVTFTLTVTNDGPDTATSVLVTDQLPAGFAFVSDNGATTGIYDDTTGVWTAGDILSGGTVSLDIIATMNNAGALLNNAEITSADQPDVDSTPGNNSGVEDDEANVSVDGQAADLSLSKAVDDIAPGVGDEVVFTLTVSNSGPSDASGVTVLDKLPAGLDYVSDDSGGNYNSVSGLWIVGNVPNGASATIAITAKVVGTTALSNSAEISSSDQPDPDSIPGDGSTTEDDDARVSVDPQQADLNLGKSVDNATPNVGDDVTFILTLNNAGPSDATGVTVTDKLADGFVYVSDDSGGTYDAVTGVWAVGGVDDGETKSLTIIATVVGADLLFNVAEVSSSDQPDGDSVPGDGSTSDDDDAQVSVEPQQADLSLAKTVDNASPAVGDQVTFTLTLGNAGPSDATGVSVIDLLPDGFEYLSDTSGGSYNPASGLWVIGDVDAGNIASISIVVEVTEANSATNTAEVASSDQPDGDSTPGDGSTGDDDDAQVTVDPTSQSDLSLVKSVNNAAPVVGDEVTFTLVLTNAGPTDATGVTVTDQLAAGFEYIADNSGGAYDPVTGVWQVGSVTDGASATLTITAKVSGFDPLTNFAEVTSSDQPDDDSTPGDGSTTEDDDAVISVTPQSADLSLSKVVDNSAPSAGDVVAFTLQLDNAGPSDASGITVTDQLPAGFEYISDSSGGTYSQLTGVWSVGSLGNGESISINITARVVGTDVLTNTAEVTASDLPDPDSTVDNTSNSEDDDAATVLTVQPKFVVTSDPVPPPPIIDVAPPIIIVSDSSSSTTSSSTTIATTNSKTSTPNSVTVASLFTTTGDSSINPVSLTGQLRDQIVSGGIIEYTISDGEFSHTDNTVRLTFEAFQPNGEPLPQFVKFDPNTGTFKIDGDAANAANIDNLQIRVVASDPNGNQVSSTFEVKFAETLVSESESTPGNDPSAPETGSSVVDGTSTNIDSAQETSSPDSGANNGLSGASNGQVDGTSSPALNPMTLTVALQDQTVSEGVITYSIDGAFNHSNPQELLNIIVELEDGSPLPDFITFNESTGEFFIDADQARAAGVVDVTIKVTASDSAGNTISDTFSIVVETLPEGDGLDSDHDQAGSDGGYMSQGDTAVSVMIESREAPAWMNALEMNQQGSVAGSDVMESLDNQFEAASTGKMSLKDQVMRAGELGYQQEKLKFSMLLNELFKKG
jgi:large repetitive protein